MTAAALLSRVEKLIQTGPNSWRARCPTAAHGPKSGAHLHITETADGAVLLKCFSHGCPASEIVAAVGLDLSDLFPPRVNHGAPVRNPFPALAVLRSLAHESAVVLACSRRMLAGEALPPGDHERLSTAAERFQAASSACAPTFAKPRPEAEHA